MVKNQIFLVLVIPAIMAFFLLISCDLNGDLNGAPVITSAVLQGQNNIRLGSDHRLAVNTFFPASCGGWDINIPVLDAGFRVMSGNQELQIHSVRLISGWHIGDNIIHGILINFENSSHIGISIEYIRPSGANDPWIFNPVDNARMDSFLFRF